MLPYIRLQINNDDREYYIKKVNEPIVKAVRLIHRGTSWIRLVLALIEIASSIKKYPEPTLENVLHPNAKWLLLKQEEYLKYEDNKRIAEVAKVLVRGAVIKIEHSPNYRKSISWWLEDNGGWRPYGR